MISYENLRKIILLIHSIFCDILIYDKVQALLVRLPGTEPSKEMKLIL